MNLIIIIAISLTLLGLVLFYLNKINKQVDKFETSAIAKLKENAEVSRVDFDKCEFKSGTFSHEIKDPNLQSIKFIAPTGLKFLMNDKISETVVQSYLTYETIINGEKLKYISQSFPFDTTTLKYHVLNQNLSLYVNKFDKRKYLFELVS